MHLRKKITGYECQVMFNNMLAQKGENSNLNQNFCQIQIDNAYETGSII